MPFLTNVKVAYYPPNATSMLQPLDLGIIKVLQALVSEAPSKSLVCFMDLEQETENQVSVMQVLHYTAAASRNINTEADSASSNEGKNDGFHEDWIQVDTENNIDFSYYRYVESKFATLSISSIDKLCDDCEGGKRSKEAEEEDRCEQETCAKHYHTTHCLQNC